ncbi:MAG: hypothetical protein FWD68_19975 [Alphaproteobacteria bacterium]|nr:hypothetical protein [Alphaproteobacteria bacterium]
MLSTTVERKLSQKYRDLAPLSAVFRAIGDLKQMGNRRVGGAEAAALVPEFPVEKEISLVLVPG